MSPEEKLLDALLNSADTDTKEEAKSLFRDFPCSLLAAALKDAEKKELFHTCQAIKEIMEEQCSD